MVQRQDRCHNSANEIALVDGSRSTTDNMGVGRKGWARTLTARSAFGLVLIISGCLVLGLAALMSFGALLEFTRPGALLAVICWVSAALLFLLGVYFRRR